MQKTFCIHKSMLSNARKEYCLKHVVQNETRFWRVLFCSHYSRIPLQLTLSPSSIQKPFCLFRLSLFVSLHPVSLIVTFAPPPQPPSLPFSCFFPLSPRHIQEQLYNFHALVDFFKSSFPQYYLYINFFIRKLLLTLRYQTQEGFPQWGQFFQNNF